MNRIELCIGLILTLLLTCNVNAQQAQADAPAPGATLPTETGKYPERWNMVTASLGTDAGVKQFTDMLKESKDVGCTHILMKEGGWLRQSENKAYLARVEKVKAAAKELNITLVPAMFAFGYSGSYLGFNPNLGAGLPVKDMPFVVQGKTAVPDPASELDLSKFTGDATFKVPKFMYYRVTLISKEKPVDAEKPDESDEPFRVSGVNSHRWLTRTNTYIKQDGDHWVSTNTFNTLDDDTIRVRIKCTEHTSFKVESAGPLLILRRDMTPLVVTNEDGSITYEEGKDFKKLVDPVIGSGKGEFASDHQANNIELTDDSRIKDGQKIKASFFHAYRIYKDQDTITMEDPRVYDIMDKDAANCIKVWGADGYFMNFDEIRIGGWEKPDKKPGQILADITKRGYDDIRKAAPDAKIYTWSDMYAPTENAIPFADKSAPYYLVNGNWDGSWEGVPKDVIILSWESNDVVGMKWFSDQGYSQVLCGYYDAASTKAMKNNISAWKQNTAGDKNILGFMYATWHHNFKNMKEYFTLLDTYDQWSGSKAIPEAVPGVK